MRTSLVTGAGGFVGGAVAERLLERGDRVICLTNAYKPLGHRPILKYAMWIYGSVTDERLVRDAVGRYEPNEIYHYAASAQVRSGERDPSGTIDVNVMGTRNVLEACRTCGTVGAVLVASSDKSYGEPATPAREDDALVPLHVYDATKASMDFLAQAYARDFGLPVIVTRSCNIYGPGDLNWCRVVPGTMSRLHSKLPPVLHQGADQMERQFVYIDDYVDAAIHLTGQVATLHHNVFNVGGEIVQVARLVRMIIDAFGSSVAPEIKAMPFKELKAQSVNVERLRGTGWQTKVGLHEGIIQSARWYKDFLDAAR